MDNAGISNNYLRKGFLSPRSRPCRMLSNKVRDYLMKRAVVQSDVAISKLYACLGMPKIIDNAVGKCGKKRIWSSISRLIERRHQIAHNADLSVQGCTQEINFGTVSKWLEKLEEFIQGVESVMDCRFAKKKAVTKKNTLVKTMKAPEIRKIGYLDAMRMMAVARIADIGDIFNVPIPKKGFQYPGAIRFSYGDCVDIWWPKIGTTENAAGWMNTATCDQNGLVIELKEKNVKNQNLNKLEMVKNASGKTRRIVFANIDGEPCDTGYCYRFIGLFDLDEGKSKKESCRIWKRVATKIELEKGSK